MNKRLQFAYLCCTRMSGSGMKNSDPVIFSRSGASRKDRLFFGFSDCVPRIINLKFTNGLRTFVGPRPRRDGRAGIIQNGRLPRSNARVRHAYNKGRNNGNQISICQISICLFDVRVPVVIIHFRKYHIWNMRRKRTDQSMS